VKLLSLVPKGGFPMKFAKYLFLAVALVVGAAAVPAPAEHTPTHAELQRAIDLAFGVPEPVTVQLVTQGVPVEELPAVALISTRAKVEPVKVVELRKSGLSYVQVSQKLGVGPEVFYVPFDSDPGPPYGKAWGYWKNNPREKWNTLVLTDEELVNLANMQLITNAYKVPPAKVIELRSAGKDYMLIHRELAGGATVAVAPGATGAPVAVVVEAPGVSERRGFNIDGGDYTKVRLGTLAECQTTCTGADQCRAYSYNVKDRMCYLKDVVGRYSPRSDVVSGEKGS
jgi:hypothetical protein